ncbi:CDP-glycerol glycerophosphotransferase family protein [Bacillus nitroreducens]
MNYKVSVIITNYNKEKYIRNAIESVLRQNLKEVQIIIIDDGSTDGSSEICQEYAKQFSNVFYFKQDNKGVSAARNLGITKVEAEYLTFLDADDFVTKDGYEKLFIQSKNNNAETAIGNIVCFDNERQWKLSYMKKVFSKKGSIVQNIKMNPELHLTPSVNNKLFNTEFIRKNKILFDETQSVGEDLLFTQKSLFLSYKTIVYDIDVLYYRVVKTEESLSKEVSITYFEKLVELQQKIKKLYKEIGIIHFLQHIEKRQIKYFLDSIFNKGPLLEVKEQNYLLNVGLDFFESVSQIDSFEYLEPNYRLLVTFILQEKYEETVKLLQINRKHKMKSEKIVKGDTIFHYLYRFFPEYKSILKVNELKIIHRIEVFKFIGEELTIGGYAYLEGMSTERIKKELIFKSDDKSKAISLENALRTDISYLFSNNTINYDQSGFETLNINLLEELGEGKWEVFIKLSIDNVEVEQKVEVILAQLRNYFKPHVKSNLLIIPTFIKGKYFTFRIKKSSLTEKMHLKLSQTKKNIKYDLSFLLKKDFQTFFVIILYKLLGNLFRKKNIWLIGERRDTAQDNSYHLFKFIRENHPKINIHYVIDKSSRDLSNVRRFGNIIDFGSIKHSFYLLVCNKSLNSYAELPNMYTESYKKILKFYPEWQQNQKIFLQHGVIGVSRVNHSLHKNRTNYSLFIVSSEFEKKHIIEEFGYKEDEVIVTGLARWDALKDTSEGKQILLMPTWRSWIKSESKLKDSTYFKKYLELLQSEKLHQILEKKDLTLTFYPHYQIQKLLGELPKFHDRIFVVRQGEETVQSLLRRHSLLITDYSTVSFDFAYMKKPVIFYQFDYDEFYSEHYNEGPIDHKKELFGKRVLNQEELLLELKSENAIEMKKEFLEKSNCFISYRNKNHSSRIYEEIINNI